MMKTGRKSISQAFEGVPDSNKFNYDEKCDGQSIQKNALCRKGLQELNKSGNL